MGNHKLGTGRACIQAPECRLWATSRRAQYNWSPDQIIRFRREFAASSVQFFLEKRCIIFRYLLTATFRLKWLHSLIQQAISFKFLWRWCDVWHQRRPLFHRDYKKGDRYICEHFDTEDTVSSGERCLLPHIVSRIKVHLLWESGTWKLIYHA